MKTIDIDKLLKIGIALSSEKDKDKLLSTILSVAIDIAGCDGGTLYTHTDNDLNFAVMITKSKGIFKCGSDIKLPPVPFDSTTHVISDCTRNNKVINIPRVYDNCDYNFSGTKNYDRLNEYNTVSLLCIPMQNNRDEIIGGLQLINALGRDGAPVPFDDGIEPVIRSLASQAAICLTNVNYAAEIIALLDAFVQAMAEAVDARSPYNANHTRNMVKYGRNFCRWLRDSGNAWRPSEDDEHAILMSIWLHDVGKLAVPLEIMDKEDRLGDRKSAVYSRLTIAELSCRLRYAEGKISKAEFENSVREAEQLKTLIDKTLSAGFLNDEILTEIKKVSEYRWTDIDGVSHTYLTPDETEALSIRKGTLTAAERKIIESHVVITARILAKLPFPKQFSRVYENAVSHHEYPNGKGYPTGQIKLSRETLLITIIDVFDALTAEDRPYKPPMPAEKAFGILQSMAADGQIDGGLLGMFIESGAWK